MDAPKAIRSVKGKKGVFYDTIQRLSFQCRNLANGMASDSIQSLTKVLPEGIVTVTRIGGMRGEGRAREFVKVTVIEEGDLLILLSSAQKDTYGIGFKLSDNECKVLSKVKKLSLKKTFFEDTYIDPNMDKYAETCNFIYTLDHRKFIIVINGDNQYQVVAVKPRDDWHNNNYRNNALLDEHQHFLSYYETCTQYHLSEAHISWSFSPFTHIVGLPHIDRYIDQEKRKYIPILGRGADFAKKYPELAGAEGLPYGKKPFTITKDGIVTFKEVVAIDQIIAVPNPTPNKTDFGMYLFWPFIPYMREIPYFNIQYLSGFPMTASMQDFDPFCSYEMRYSDAGGEKRIPLRTDEISGWFSPSESPGELETTIDCADNETPGGVSTQKIGAGQANEFWISKSASIGTVGDKRDLHVQTTLSGRFRYVYDYNMLLERVSNFPCVYYKPEFVDTLFWRCCPYADKTDAKEKWEATHVNAISGIQKLKLGDMVIDQGDIRLDFDDIETSQTVHNGTATTHGDCPESIGYTSLITTLGGRLSFIALDANGNEVIPTIGSKFGASALESTDRSGFYLTDESGKSGTISRFGYYIAPNTNPECSIHPIVQLESCGNVVDTVELTVTKPPSAGIAYQWSCTKINPEALDDDASPSASVLCIHPAGLPGCGPGGGDLCQFQNCWLSKTSYYCDDTIANQVNYSGQASAFCVLDNPFPQSNCANDMTLSDCNNQYHTWAWWAPQTTCSGNPKVDCRNAAMITAGCCPRGLE